MGGFSSLGGQQGANLAPVTFVSKDTYVQARAYVKIADSGPYAIKSFTLEKNCHGATNTASFELPYATYPDWTDQLFYGQTSGSNDSYTPVFIQIYGGFPTNPGQNLESWDNMFLRFSGILDEYDPDNLNVTHFQCRSMAAPLTTDRITTQVQNLTSVDFLNQVCGQYGIDSTVDAQLTSPATIAEVYSQEYLVGLKNLIKWDVLQRSSIVDDVDVWEDDGTVFYVHPWNVQTVMQDQGGSLGRQYGNLYLNYGTNVKSFKGSHASQFSRKIQVVVGSYRNKVRISTSTTVNDENDGTSVTTNSVTLYNPPQWGTQNGSSTVYHSNGNVTNRSWSTTGGPSQGSTSALATSGKELYTFYYPNLTPTQCQARAMAIWRQISMHEYGAEFDLAVTPSLLPFLNIEARIQLSGYGMNEFNTTYWPRKMTETFDGPSSENSADAGGWSVKYQAVNSRPPLGQGV